ncbi:uncharacterized protein PHACADRAFT_34056 [Phanerochaete carnosa HHB-10118-sp]|uniref:Uncharacterized protein n=1 Tax=Phanerochaete carnosa (strain HHB-10118-sp) TaxID=650164 RepID=K5WCV3_PHACS|nr:uncharacterized protein PHACADRAFT_34056 [Phanerochaete carnosa HHB-10118-sp]EKM48012.1 hypothetical protein PHACADRAFT_34056 [Phanerochaete carnosa HHB-10118-sp]
MVMAMFQTKRQIVVWTRLTTGRTRTIKTRGLKMINLDNSELTQSKGKARQHDSFDCAQIEGEDEVAAGENKNRNRGESEEDENKNDEDEENENENENEGEDGNFASCATSKTNAAGFENDDNVF